MTWTTTKPTKPGWYWWRFNDNTEFHAQMIVHVADNEHGLYGIFPRHLRSFNSLIEETGGQWAGPLAPPIEPPQ